MAHQFRMLGPVQALHEGQPLPLGPPKRRAMLAALLHEPNRPVPLARLARPDPAGTGCRACCGITPPSCLTGSPAPAPP